jgi:amino acid transporter
MASTYKRDDAITSALAANKLDLRAVLSVVLGATAPLTVAAGVVATAFAVTGLVNLPAGFIVVGLVLALFSVGYVAMAQRIGYSGAFYSYIAQGLNKALGVGGAWVALLAYNLLQVGLYGAAGTAANPLAKQYLGLDLPWWVFALIAWAIVGALGLLNIKVSGRVLLVLLAAEMLIILIYSVSFATHPAGSGAALEAFSPAALFHTGGGALLAIAVLGFVGFESAVVYTEETRNPHRTIKTATFASIVVVGALYALSSWALIVTTGPDKIVAAAQEQGPGLLFGTAGQQLGATWADIGSVLFVTSLLAAMISFHQTTARYTFVLGRERVFPVQLGTTRADGVPRLASMIQTLIGLAVILTYAIAGWDPLVQLFFYGGTSGGFGVLFLIFWTSIAVWTYFRRHQHEETAWRSTVAPLLSIVAVAIVLILVLANFATLLGVPESSPLRWGVPIAFLIVAVLGTLYGLRLRFARPDVYAVIGLGPTATSHGVVRTSPRDHATHRREDR